MTFMEACGTHSAEFVYSCAGGDSVELWHRRLGHLDVKSVYALRSMVKGINVVKTFPPITTLVCEACAEWQSEATMRKG